MEKALYFLNQNFWSSPALVLLFIFTVFMMVLLRYLFFSIVYHKWVQVYQKKTARKKNVNNTAQWKKEIRWSVISSLIFAILSVGSYWVYQKGYTKIYTAFDHYPIAYFILSILTVLFLYETYYYWLHRWMHHPKIFRVIHKVHHDSKHTSVFTSFSFHPWESLLQFAFLPVIIMIIPLHYYAIGIVLLIMTVSAIVNHAGVEIFSKKFINHPIGKWLIGSTHHSLHHAEYRSNFGLYFTFWDKWMKTESGEFERKFAENTATVIADEALGDKETILSQSQHHH